MRTPLLAAIVLTAAVSISAQPKPDFTGTWVNTRVDANSASNLNGVVGVQRMTIKQTASAITVERAYGRGSASITLKLDGSRTRYVLDPGPGPRGAATPRELVSRVTWKGDKLTIATEFSRIDPSLENYVHFTTETLSLQGDELILERTEQGRGPVSEPSNRGILPPKDIYKRAGPVK
jgi:hypothetical protein